MFSGGQTFLQITLTRSLMKVPGGMVLGQSGTVLGPRTHRMEEMGRTLGGPDLWLMDLLFPSLSPEAQLQVPRGTQD